MKIKSINHVKDDSVPTPCFGVTIDELRSSIQNFHEKTRNDRSYDAFYESIDFMLEHPELYK